MAPVINAAKNETAALVKAEVWKEFCHALAELISAELLRRAQ
jgi:hypothetical protein